MRVGFILLLLLSVCHGKPDLSSDLGSNIKSMPIQLQKSEISVVPGNVTKDTPNLYSEYAQTIEAYRAFLAGEKSYTNTIGDKVTIAPNHGGKYTLVDMTDDGIPELLTNVIIQQIRDTEFNMYASSFTCGIYTYENDEIVEWYMGGDDSFELLSNKAILFEYEGLSVYNYFYYELDNLGECAFYMHAYKKPIYESEDWEYYISYERYGGWESGIKVTSEEEWLELLEPYLSLRTNIIPWNDYTIKPHIQ